MIEYSKDIQ